MTRRLASYVSVHTPEQGTVTFGPDDTVPAWAVGLISNPKAWVDAPDEPVAVTTDDDEGDDVSDPVIPPVKGRGSSATAWAGYARAHGFEVEPDAKASEIREALAEAGIPIE